MTALWRAARLIWTADPWAMWRGAAAAVAVLIMGAALLGLSGWFITATGLAGLAGIGIAFDVFRPSAGVRFLALGRAGARYAERLLTHDATLRALARVRVYLLQRLEQWPLDRLRRLRASAQVTRLTADVDALDGLVLRLVLPVAAALVTHVAAFAVLAWLTAPAVAIAIAMGYVAGGGLVLLRLGHAAFGPSAESEEHIQTLRRQVIGLFRGQRDAILQAGLGRELDRLRSQETALRDVDLRLDRLDRRSGMSLSTIATGTTAAVMMLAGGFAGSGDLDPALAALGVFVSLGLAETLLPLRRGLADIGRMRSAATRVLDGDAPTPQATLAATVTPDPARGISAHGLAALRPGGADTRLFTGLDLDVPPGRWLAVRGPSGSGKSTLLEILAGLQDAGAGEVLIMGQPRACWSEAPLRAHLTLVPQRATLIGGTICENLSLAVEHLDDEAAWAALRTVSLDGTVRARGGLELRLGEGGSGLSGGEARRLVLARALLREPRILLLDEPTEGLEEALAKRVLTSIRAALPEASVLLASHRPVEIAAADDSIDLHDSIQESKYN